MADDNTNLLKNLNIQKRIAAATKESANSARDLVNINELFRLGMISNEHELDKFLARYKTLKTEINKTVDELYAGNSSLEDWRKSYQKINYISADNIKQIVKLNKNLVEVTNLWDDASHTTEDISDNVSDISDSFKDISKFANELKDYSFDISKEWQLQLKTNTSLLKSLDNSVSGHSKLEKIITSMSTELSAMGVKDPFAGLVDNDELDNLHDLINNINSELHSISSDGVTIDLSNADIDVKGLVDKLEATMSTLSGKYGDLGTSIVDGMAAAFDVDATDLNKVVSSLVSGSASELENANKIVSSIWDKLKTDGKSATAFNSQLAQVVKTAKDISNTVSEFEIGDKLYDNIRKMSAEYTKMGSAIADTTHTTDQLIVNIQRMANDVVPAWLSNMLNIDESFSMIRKTATKALDATFLKIAQGGSKTEALTTFGKTFGSNISSALTPLMKTGLIIAGIAIAVKLIWSAVSFLSETSKKYSEALGVSRATSFGIYKDTVNIVTALGNKLTTEEDVLAILKQQKETYGIITNLKDKDVVNSINLAGVLGKQYGIAADQIYQASTALSTAGLSPEASDNMLAYLSTASDLSGISFDNITKDLNESTAEIAMYFSKLGPKIGKSILKIKQLGMSVKQVGSLIEKTWDITDFRKNMTELAIMTGGSTNLSKYFELSFSGNSDPSVMMGEVAYQWDNMVASGKANQFTMKQFADTVGLSVEELQKQAIIRSKLSHFDDAQKKALNDHLDQIDAVTLGDAKAAKLVADQYVTTDAMAKAWGDIKLTLTKMLLPIMQSLAKVVSGLIPLLEGGEGALSAIGSLLSVTIIPLFEGMLTPFIYLAKLLTFISKYIESFGSSTKSVNGELVTTNSLAQTISKVIFGIGATMATWWAGGKIVKFFTGGKDAAISMFGAVKKVGTGIGKLKDTVMAGPKGLLNRVKNFIKPSAITVPSVEDAVDVPSGDASQTVDNKKTKDKKKTRKLITKSKDEANKLGDNAKAPAESGAKLKQFLINLADGIKYWGKGAAKIMLGAAAMGGALVLLGAGLAGALWMISKVDQKGMLALAAGITVLAIALRIIGKGAGDVIKGGVALAVASLAFIPLAYGLSMLKGVDPMALVAISLGIITLAGTMVLLGLSLAPMGAFMAAGAVALLAIGGVLVLFAKMINSLPDISGKLSVIGKELMSFASELKFTTMASAGLGILAFAGSLVSAALLLSAGAVLIAGAMVGMMLFAAGLTVLTGSLTLFAATSTLLSAVGPTLTTLVGTLSQLHGTQLLGAAAGIVAITGALTLLSSGKLFSSIAGGLTSIADKLFGQSSPIDQLNEFATVGPGIDATANAIHSLSAALNELSDTLDGTNLSKLSDIKLSATKLKVDTKNVPTIKSTNPSIKQSNDLQANAREYTANIAPSNNNNVNNKGVNKNTNNNPSQQLTQGIEKALLAVANRPIIVNIGGTELRSLNRKLVGLNNTSR